MINEEWRENYNAKEKLRLPKGEQETTQAGKQGEKETAYSQKNK